jgi:hypothetical protein
MRSSSCLSVSRLASRSKVPPQLGEPLGVLPELSRALALCHVLLLYDTSRPALGRTARWVNCRRYEDSRNSLFRVVRGSAATDLEDLLAARENVIQGVLKMRRAVGELPTNLIDVLLVALFDFLPKQLLQRSIANTFIATLREVDDEI